MVESFWAIPDVTDLRTPLSILREQAAALTDQTKGTLVGLVGTENWDDGNIKIKLDISVPALNDYRYRILSYDQPLLELYPGRLYPSPEPNVGEGSYKPIGDEAAFVSSVKAILSSERVKRSLAALLAQAKEV